MRTAAPWKDPRTGIYYLRKRIPTRLKAASGRSGDVVKISLETADRAMAARAWPGVLTRYAAMEAEWERAANVVELTPSGAAELAARWGVWIAADLSRLDTGGEVAALFEEDGTSKALGSLWDRRVGRAPRAERRLTRLRLHADEATRLADFSVSEASKPALQEALRPVVAAAYREAALRAQGIKAGEGDRWNPLAAATAKLSTPTSRKSVQTAPKVSLRDLFGGWKGTATVKSRTITETGYILDQLIEHLQHEDAARVDRADLAGWRDALKAAGKTNTTWNNRLSLVRQVFEWGVTEGRLTANPADAKLRLKKQRAATRLPYSDDDVVRILSAARGEARPSLRWAPWIMALSGMRVAEVLQLDARDVRQEGETWCLAVHEDTEDKSVKTGQRRNVPLHPALVAEGLLDYAASLPPSGPLFPDKGLDSHGLRGGRGWNLTGQWVRDKVGITDPAKAPNHSFRHRMEDELRAAEVPEDVRDAILGHARKTSGRHYGVRGEALKRLAEHLARVPVPSGL